MSHFSILLIVCLVLKIPFGFLKQLIAGRSVGNKNDGERQIFPAQTTGTGVPGCGRGGRKRCVRCVSRVNDDPTGGRIGFDGLRKGVAEKSRGGEKDLFFGKCGQGSEVLNVFCLVEGGNDASLLGVAPHGASEVEEGAAGGVPVVLVDGFVERVAVRGSGGEGEERQEQESEHHLRGKPERRSEGKKDKGSRREGSRESLKRRGEERLRCDAS